MIKANKNALAQNFSAAAETYNQYASAQETIASQLIKLIQKYANQNPATIADLGCGTGLLSQRLTQIFPEAILYCVDIAQGMLNKCEESLIVKNKPNAHFISADIENITLSKKAQLITSNYALQWTEYEQTIGNIYSNLEDNGFIALAIPVAGSFNELHTAYRAACSHELASYPSAQDYIACISEHKMKIIFHEESEHKCSFDSALSALRSIKKIGANFSGHDEHKTLSPSQVIKLIHEYENLCGKDKTTMTYRTLYVIAQKP